MDFKLFRVSPIILRVGEPARIVIHARQEHARHLLDRASAVKFHAMTDTVDGYGRTASWNGWKDCPPMSFERADGELILTVTCPEEDEYTIVLEEPDPRFTDGRPREIASFSLYAVASDLFERRPYKGDFHLHSFASDGRESPAYVAASCRREGFDFMALTDHRRYAPSLEAAAAMKQFGTEMKCYPGEEVHLPDNPVHIINFGGSFSVNDRANADRPAFDREVGEYRNSLPAGLDPETAYQTAASEWAFDRIREGGGVSLFSHPYWRPAHHNYIGAADIDLLLERQKFDALEVFGGFYLNELESNMLALSRYGEERAKGKNLPAVGVSDSHGCDTDLFGWYYTIVFAASDAFPDLAAAIRAEQCVAVQAVPGTFPLLAGPFRLVRFAYFLLREFYPGHDSLCRREGEIMRLALSGEEPCAAELIARRKDDVHAWSTQMFAE